MKNTPELTKLIEAIVEEFDFSKTVVYDVLENFDFLKIKNQDAEWLINEFNKDEETAMDVFSDLYTNRVKLKEAKRLVIKAKQDKTMREFNKEFIHALLTTPELAATRQMLGV